MKDIRVWGAALVCAGSVLAAQAADIEYNVQFTGIEHQFVQADPDQGMPSPAAQTILTIGSLPMINGTLEEGDQFTINYTVPPGMLLHVFDPPAGSTDAMLAAVLWTADTLWFPVSLPIDSVVLGRLDGPAPAPVGALAQIGDTGEFLDDNAQFNVSAQFVPFDMELNSFSISMTMPLGFSRTFTNFTPSTAAFGVAVFLPDGSQDPGPLMELVVPEPAAISILTLAAVPLVLRRSRSMATR